MNRNQTHHRGRIAFVCIMLCLCMAGLTGRLFFLMIYKADYYSEMAEDLHQRERTIKAERCGDCRQPDSLYHIGGP